MGELLKFHIVKGRSGRCTFSGREHAVSNADLTLCRISPTPGDKRPEMHEDRGLFRKVNP